VNERDESLTDRDAAAAQLAALQADREALADRVLQPWWFVLGVAVAVLSRRWGRAYVAELREGL
jgi:hypothetical protein